MKKSELLMRAAKILNSSLELDTLLRNMLNITTEYVEAEASSIILLDSKNERLEFYISLGEKVSKLEKTYLELGKGVAGWVADSGKGVVVDDVSTDDRFYPVVDETSEFKTRSLLCVPLKRTGAVLGVVEALNKKGGGKFTPEDLEVMNALADQMAIALENAHLIAKAKRETLEKVTLFEVGKKLSMYLDMDEILEQIVDLLYRVVRYDAVGIYLINSETQEIENVVTRGMDPEVESKLHLKVGQGVVGWVAKMGKSVLVPDVISDERYIRLRPQTASEIAVPIKAGEEIIGVFNLESDQKNAYDEENLDLVEAFASQAAVTIERARLHQEALEKRRLEGELSIARQIQTTFLPKGDPQVKGFDIAGMNIPSSEVGGDFFDFIKIVENQLGVAIADVSGKGIPAALIMAAFRASLKAEILNNYAIRTIFQKVNRLLFESIEREMYVTAVYGVLDTKNRVLTFSNAGHNPPILRRADGSIEYLSDGGVALGVLELSTYEERPLSLFSGDVLILYTDGVTEAFSPEGEEFGLHRLVEVIEEKYELSARDLLNEIYERVQDFTSDSAQLDDLTMVAIKVLPPGSLFRKDVHRA
ncbi:MAG: SpoIIE family protein phosphatase [Candidatus Zixiibacteriota bacterium]